LLTSYQLSTIQQLLAKEYFAARDIPKSHGPPHQVLVPSYRVIFRAAARYMVSLVPTPRTGFPSVPSPLYPRTGFLSVPSPLYPRHFPALFASCLSISFDSSRICDCTNLTCQTNESLSLAQATVCSPSRFSSCTTSGGDPSLTYLLALPYSRSGGCR
jgi:hypothetical protein